MLPRTSALRCALTIALACQQAGEGAVAACIFGDGACGAGALHEVLNIAALWQLPLLFVCNNNGLSVSTRVERAAAFQPLASIAAPYGIAHKTIDGMDVVAVRAERERIVGHVVPTGREPFFAADDPTASGSCWSPGFSLRKQAEA